MEDCVWPKNNIFFLFDSSQLVIHEKSPSTFYLHSPHLDFYMHKRRARDCHEGEDIFNFLSVSFSWFLSMVNICAAVAIAAVANNDRPVVCRA